MDYIGTWVFHSIAAMNDDERGFVYLSAEDYLKSPMPYVDERLFNVHNYFDYVVNYIICKLENGHYIQNISALVFEAKTDNAAAASRDFFMAKLL